VVLTIVGPNIFGMHAYPWQGRGGEGRVFLPNKQQTVMYYFNAHVDLKDTQNLHYILKKKDAR
jgi:hypothetical protein